MPLLRQAVIPAYVLICIIFGGASNGGFVANAALQFVALAIMVWAFWSPARTSPGTSQRHLGWIALGACGIVALQFVPVPSALWEISSGRRELIEEAALIGLVYSPKFWSLSPYEALKSAVWVLPAAAVGIAMARLPDWKPAHVASAIIVGMVLSVIVGTVQITQGRDSPAYFYEITNRGSTVGFFANSNHLATLLLISLPMLFALVQSAQSSRSGTPSPPAALTGLGALFLVLAGLGINGSLAGFGLAGPVVLASLFIILRRRSHRRITGLALLSYLLGALVLLVTSGGQSLLNSGDLAGSAGGRATIWRNTWQAILDFLPFGSGLGTFTETYARYEDASAVTNVYINHAHNDYLELLAEFGILILPLLFAAAAWWIWRAKAAFQNPDAPFALAGSIGSGAVLVHSMVDYPLRTAAISTVFVVCICLMALSKRKAVDQTNGQNRVS